MLYTYPTDLERGKRQFWMGILDPSRRSHGSLDVIFDSISIDGPSMCLIINKLGYKCIAKETKPSAGVRYLLHTTVLWLWLPGLQDIGFLDRWPGSLEVEIGHRADVVDRDILWLWLRSRVFDMTACLSTR